MPPTHARVVTRERVKQPEATTQVLPHAVIHVIACVPASDRMKWVEGELGSEITLQVAENVGEVVSALLEDTRGRPQMLVIDVDPLSAGELFHLHQVRERGWCGAIVALGQVPPSLRASLQIARALRAPFVKDALADEVARYRCATQDRTIPLPVFPAEGSGCHRTFG